MSLDALPVNSSCPVMACQGPGLLPFVIFFVRLHSKFRRLLVSSVIQNRIQCLTSVVKKLISVTVRIAQSSAQMTWILY
jgi:hypothetical protein